MTSTETPRFIGRADHGTCERCSRELTGAYILDIPGTGVVRMGRRCAARAMGWATSRVEMEAVAAEFRARKIADRRAAGFTMEDARALAAQAVTDDPEATAAALYAEVWA